MAYSAPTRTIRSGLTGYDMGEALDSRQIEWSISRERKGFILDWRIYLHQTRDDRTLLVSLIWFVPGFKHFTRS